MKYFLIIGLALLLFACGPRDKLLIDYDKSTIELISKDKYINSLGYDTLNENGDFKIIDIYDGGNKYIRKINIAELHFNKDSVYQMSMDFKYANNEIADCGAIFHYKYIPHKIDTVQILRKL